MAVPLVKAMRLMAGRWCCVRPARARKKSDGARAGSEVISGRMTALREEESRFYTEEEFFAGKDQSPDASYEYVDGRIYAMSYASDRHEFVAGNIFARLHGHLRGKKCRVFKGGMLVRLKFLGRVIDYLPDVMVACDEKPDNRLYREEPLAIFEVLSPSTQAIDQREKLFAYTTIPSLRRYIILHQDRMALLHMKRSGEKWEETFVTDPEALVEVPEIGFSMRVTEIYDEVDFTAE